MVGSLREAKAAYFSHLRNEISPLVSYAGAGMTRKVYVNRARTVVYKIDIYSNTNKYNIGEYRFTTRARKESGLNYIPPTSLHQVLPGVFVLAMPYYPHSINHFGPARAAEIINGLAKYLTGRWGVTDLHENNFRLTAGGQARVIDMGFMDHY